MFVDMLRKYLKNLFGMDNADERRLRLILFAEMLVFVVVFSYLSILRHNRLNSAMYDLGLFDQIIWNIAHGRFFESSIKGFNYLGDHFSPVLVLFAPLYWIWEDVRMLLVAQTVIISFAGYYAGLLSYNLTKDIKVSSAFGLAILGNSNVLLVVLFDFHPEVITIPLFTYIVYRVTTGDHIKVFIASVAALAIKEDVAITVTFTGFAFAILKKEKKYLLLSLIGSIYFILVMKVFIPYFRPKSFTGDYLYMERYSYLGNNIKEVLINIITNPLYPVVKMFKWTKLKVLLRLFYPTMFLSFLSPAFLIVILPILYINWIPNYPPQFALKYQYLNIVIPFIITSSIYGYVRLKDLLKEKGFLSRNLSLFVTILMVVFVIGNCIITHSTVVRFKYFEKNYYEDSFYEAKKLIPENASLATANTLGPHFSHRRVIEFHVPFNLHMYHYKRLNLKMYSDADYQLFLTKGDTSSVPPVLTARIKDLIEKYNYSVIFERDDILLLRKNQ
ncbi:MAG: DUF2079 domain-containing protein [Deltaproteobacteria bacterium]|nr:DUF2079 domain-containing protein [Deltaproteobacteria bacterium]